MLIFPCRGDLERRAVSQPAVWPMVVGVDVASDLLAGLAERLEFFTPGAAQFGLREPQLDERLGIGVAVAAAAMGDMPCSARRARKARLVKAVPLSVPKVKRPGLTWRCSTARSITAVASWAGQRMSMTQPVISRVQQSIAALR